MAVLVDFLQQHPIVIRDPSSPAALREAIARRPSDGASNAKLSLALLRPTVAVAPNADATSLYGGEFTLGHPAVAESRMAMEAALKYSPKLVETQLAHQAVLMVEGRAEEAIQPGRRALDLAPTSADAHAALARGPRDAPRVPREDARDDRAPQGARPRGGRAP